MRNKILLCIAALALARPARGAVTLSSTPASLTFTYQFGAITLPPAQTLSVKCSSGTISYTAATDEPWLTVSPDQGNLPGSLSVKVNPTSMPVGTQPAAHVLVNVAGVPQLSVVVTLVVTPPPASLTPSPLSLSFTAPPTPVATQTFTLATDSLPIAFTATSGAAWLTLNADGGSPASSVTGVVLSPANPVTLTVTVDPSALSPQSAAYAAKITIVASGPAIKTKSQNLTVNFTVNAAQPTITSVWPSELPVNGAAATITIQGTNFYSKSVAMVQGVATPLVTTPDAKSSKILTAVVPASLQTTAQVLQVYVTNGTGLNSSTANITVGSGAQILGIVNAASYASGPVGPGELVTIFGTNIGPANAATMNVTNGYVDTSLSNVSVKIDGKDAPIIYASQNQVSVQVPYEVSIGTGKTVALVNGTNNANSTVTTQASAPGIFTSDGSGSGAAAVLNYNSSTQQYTLNSSTNPAHIGDIVLVYLTGEGDYNSSGPLSGVPGASNTGYIIPESLAPLPQMGTLPTVTIGGVDASSGVLYAGPLYDSILGLLQMNVTIPAGSATGNAVPIQVTIGSNSTQANVTLAVHQ
ncbi:MAG TPA: IPT/TIG domain-containing protein [Bryobacteraceae bacterium]|nr:IPT/TIG domain-containing protein [Bryobacteraceae bacterium]